MSKNNERGNSKEESRRKVINRIARIEGQLKGVRKMIEEKRDCIDVVDQITAVREALNMLGIEILKDDLICKLGKKKIDEVYLKTLFKLK